MRAKSTVLQSQLKKICLYSTSTLKHTRSKDEAKAVMVQKCVLKNYKFQLWNVLIDQPAGYVL